MTQKTNEELTEQLAELMRKHNPAEKLNPEKIKVTLEEKKENILEDLRELSVASSFMGAISVLASCTVLHLATLNWLAIGVTVAVAVVLVIVVRVMNDRKVMLDLGTVDQFADRYQTDRPWDIIAKYEVEIGGIHQYAPLLKDTVKNLDPHKAEEWYHITRQSEVGMTIHEVEGYYEMIMNLKRIVTTQHDSPYQDEVMRYWNTF